MSTNLRLWRGPITDNATTAGVQDSGVVAATGQNDYFAVWRDGSNFNGGRPTIVGRHFDSLGNPLTGDVVLTGEFDDTFYVLEPAAVRRPIPGQADGLAIAFTNDFNNAHTDYDIYVGRTNPSMSVLQVEFIDISNKVTRDPSITSFSDGSLVVAYTIENSTSDWDILARRVGPDWSLGTIFPIFDDTDRSDNVDLATLQNGNFVAVYESQFQGDGNDHDIFFKVFNPTGGVVIDSTEVLGGADFANETFPRVAALAGGGFVVTWGDSNGDSSGYGIRATLFNAAGAVVKGNILVNGTPPSGVLGPQTGSEVTGLSDGGFVIEWDDLQTLTHWAQRFDSGGNRLGQPVAVDQNTSDAATLSDGRVVFTTSDVTSSIWSVDSVRTDFNGEFTSDLLWSNGAQGVLGLWTMQNGAIGTTTALNHDMPGWLGISGDFGGDGTADLLWRNGNGVLGLWTMQNGAIGTTTALNHDMPGWTPLAGDFNGDGTTDLLWNNGAQGALGVWEMQQGSIGKTSALNHDMPGWTALAGDFNGDGTTDLLWDNGAQGVLGVWQMKNGAILQTTALNHDMPGWTTAAGDFNGDGTDDLLWLNASGVLGVWQMQNGAISQTIALNHDMPGWSLAATGDFNRDGTTDLLWSNATGVLGLWLMQNDAIGQTISVNHDMPGWQIIA